MQTLTKILEKIGDHFAWAGWMYGIPMPRPPIYPDPAAGGPLMDTAALVDRMVDCFNRHDPEALAACCTPDARIHPAGWPQAVDTGTWLAAVPVILTTFPDLLLHPRNLAADDRVALLEARMTGTNTGPFPLSETERLLLGTQAETLPATGRATDITGVVVLEVADGRVTAERHYWPLVDGLVQLGLIGPPRHAVGQHPAHEAVH